MSIELTARQQSVLTLIAAGIQEHGYPPTLREIGVEEGISSTNGVRSILKALEKKGYITRKRYQSRAIELTEKARDVVRDSGEHSIQRDSGGSDIISLNDTVTPSSQVVLIPIRGFGVAAGNPLEAHDDIEGHIAIDANYAPHGETFALRVKGQSMIDAGIHDGDIVFCRKQDNADKGEIVVALIGNEATVKYFKPERDRVILEAANEYFGPIVVDRDAPDFRIVGKVVSLYRKFN